MLKRTFLVVKETLPTRCEVCHQADLFDAMANQCARCDSLVVTGRQGANEPARRNSAITEEEIAELLVNKQLPWSFLILVPSGLCCFIAMVPFLLFPVFQYNPVKHWITIGILSTVFHVCFLLMISSSFVLVVTEARKVFAKEPQEKNL